MSHTRETVQHSAGPDGGDEIADARRRRWYQLRPEPRRRIDFMGFNSTWWMALGWLVLLIVVAFPFPWWW
jgi:hypothetical protein